MDSRICQTSTASPAEPGELPFALAFAGARASKSSASDTSLTSPDATAPASAAACSHLSESKRGQRGL